jgi:hypothetical protein
MSHPVTVQQGSKAVFQQCEIARMDAIEAGKKGTRPAFIPPPPGSQKAGTIFSFSFLQMLFFARRSLMSL